MRPKITVDFDVIKDQNGEPRNGALDWIRTILEAEHGPMLVVIHPDVQTSGIRDGIRQWFQQFGLTEQEVAKIQITAIYPRSKLFVAPNTFNFTGETYPDPFADEETQPHIELALGDTLPPPKSVKGGKSQEWKPLGKKDIPKPKKEKKAEEQALENAEDDATDSMLLVPNENGEWDIGRVEGEGEREQPNEGEPQENNEGESKPEGEGW